MTNNLHMADRLRFILVLFTGLACIASSCSKQHTPAATTADSKNPADTLSRGSIRVMAYNIHHCNPPSKPGVIDIEAIARVIGAQQPDLVALQEVDVHTDRSGAYNQAEEIAKKLNMHYFFGKAIDYGGGEYGVAILSKFPLSETMVHRLPTQAETRGEPRIVATAKVSLPNGAEIRFGSTHLDAQKAPVNREIQMKEIGNIASAEKLPFIIAGDFNASPESEVIRELDRYFTRTCRSCPPTIPVENPDKAIDFIAYCPANRFSVKSHQVVNEKYASDHLPVVAEIRLRR
jgi:endonuclease/exonuclease/phosphatase family metal-dependent hydrolase